MNPEDEGIRIPYKNGEIIFEFPSTSQVEVFLPKFKVPKNDVSTLVREAIRHPIGCKSLREMVSSKSRVVILVDTWHRQTPVYKILPPILRELEGGGVEEKNIRIVMGHGVHWPDRKDKVIEKLGAEIPQKFQVLHHTQWSKNLSFVGWSQFGNPLWINSAILKAEIKISISHIGLNVVAGYTGGAKMILPGMAGYETIQHNHLLALGDRPRHSQIKGNTPREEMEEAGRKVGLTMSVDVILGPHAEILDVFAGDFIKAHRQGVKACKKIYEVPVREPDRLFDIGVIHSFPAHNNLFSVISSLGLNGYAVKEGGTIFLIAECEGGWMHQGCPNFANCQNGVMQLGLKFEEFIKAFVSGQIPGFLVPLFWFYHIIKTRRVLMVSELGEDLLGKIGIVKVKDLESDWARVIRNHGENFRAAVIPFGGISSLII
jgi:nickel-dependent lactate racemase